MPASSGRAAAQRAEGESESQQQEVGCYRLRKKSNPAQTWLSYSGEL